MANFLSPETDRPRPHIVIAGGSGFLGTRLSSHFQTLGYRVIVLSRRPTASNQVEWDAASIGGWGRNLEGADAVINLTGKKIACIHTEAAKKEIIESRLKSVRVIGEAIQHCDRKPAAWLQVSGIDILGDGETVRDEYQTQGDSFLASVCRQWEAEFWSAQAPLNETVKACVLRLSPVLSRDEGFFPVLRTMTRAFAGGATGNGRQHMCWIHEEDVKQIFSWMINTPGAGQTYNLVAPDVRSNSAFMTELRRACGRPWSPPAPAFAVKLGARLMGTEPDLVLRGTFGTPKRLLEAGYEFKFPTLDGAFANLVVSKR